MGKPDFLGIGAMRSGTTWLDGVLRTHPNIYLPREYKEIHYFDKHYDRDIGYYTSFFPSESEKEKNELIAGEICPGYLYTYQSCAKRIYKHLPEVRLIAILRNPVDRAYSHYGFSRMLTNEQRSFREYFLQESEVRKRGYYYTQLQHYYNLFPADNILVLIFEEVMEKKEWALEKIAHFLSVQKNDFFKQSLNEELAGSYIPRFPRLKKFFTELGHIFRKLGMHRVVNKAKSWGVPHLFGKKGKLPPLKKSTREKLYKNYYKDEIEKLEQLLQRDLSIWKPVLDKNV